MTAIFMDFKTNGHVQRYPFVSLIWSLPKLWFDQKPGLSNEQYLTSSIDPLELSETRAVKYILHIFGLLFGMLCLPRVIHLI